MLHRTREGTLDPLWERLTARAKGSPPDRTAAILLARLAMHLQRWDEAREALRLAMRLPPGPDAGILWVAARLARATEDVEAERDALEKLLRASPPPGRAREARERLLQLAVQRGDLQTARELHRALRQGAQGDPGVEGLLAEALLRAGRMQEAERAFDAAWRRLQGAPAARRRLLLAHARHLLEAGRAERAAVLLRERMPPRGISRATRLERLELLVEAHRSADRLDELIAALERLPPDAPERTRLGALYEEVGDLERAEAAWRQALRRAPHSTEPMERLAALLGRLGRTEEQLALLKRLLRSNPGEPRRLLTYLDALRRAKGTEAAERTALQWARTHGRRDPRFLLVLAERLERWGAVSSARILMERAARRLPNDPDAWSALGSQRMAEGDVAGALRAWSHVRQGGGQRLDRLVRYARLLEEHGLSKRAEAAWREVLRADPEHLEALQALAELLERAPGATPRLGVTTARQREASSLWRRLLEHPRATAGLRRLARRRLVGLLRVTGTLAAAQSRWKRAVEAPSPDPRAARLLIESLLASQPPALSEARGILQRLVDARPHDADLLRELVRLQEAEGREREAIASLRRLAELAPAEAARHLLRAAEHARHLYMDEVALQLVREAARKAPDDASVWRKLGELYLDRQQVDRAAEALHRALALDARLHQVALQLVRIETTRRRPRRAAVLLGNLLRESPDDQLLLTAGEMATSLANADAEAADIVERAMLARLREEPSRTTLRLALLQTLSAHLQRLDRLGVGGEQDHRLDRLAKRMVSPLLAALHAEDPTGRVLAVELLGRLAPSAAVLPLLAFAAETAPPPSLRREALRVAVRAAVPKHAPAFVRFAEGIGEATLAATALSAVARDCPAAALVRMAPLRQDRRTAAAAHIVDAACGGAEAVAAARRALSEPRRLSSIVSPIAMLVLALHGEARDAPLLADIGLHASPRLAAAAQTAAACLLGRLPPEGPSSWRTQLLESAARRLFAPSATLRDAAERLWVVALSPPSIAREAGCRVPPFDAWLLRQPTGEIPRLAIQWLVRRLPAAPPEGTPLPLDVLSRSLQAALATETPSRLLALRWLLDWTKGREVPAVPVGTPPSPTLLHELSPMLLRLASRGHERVRASSLRLLASNPRELPVGLLLDALQKGPAALRRAAIEVLADAPISDERLGRALAEVSIQEERWNIRRLAVLALGSWGAPRALDILDRVLREDPFQLVRIAACDALGRRHDDPRASALLHRSAQQDPSPSVRARCSALLTHPPHHGME